MAGRLSAQDRDGRPLAAAAIIMARRVSLIILCLSIRPMKMFECHQLSASE
jgi:hypothetical protein